MTKQICKNCEHRENTLCTKEGNENKGKWMGRKSQACEDFKPKK